MGEPLFPMCIRECGHPLPSCRLTTVPALDHFWWILATEDREHPTRSEVLEMTQTSSNLLFRVLSNLIFSSSLRHSHFLLSVSQPASVHCALLSLDSQWHSMPLPHLHLILVRWRSSSKFPPGSSLPPLKSWLQQVHNIVQIQSANEG